LTFPGETDPLLVAFLLGVITGMAAHALMTKK
jgi:hypothetical protein